MAVQLPQRIAQRRGFPAAPCCPVKLGRHCMGCENGSGVVTACTVAPSGALLCNMQTFGRRCAAVHSLLSGAWLARPCSLTSSISGPFLMPPPLPEGHAPACTRSQTNAHPPQTLACCVPLPAAAAAAIQTTCQPARQPQAPALTTAGGCPRLIERQQASIGAAAFPRIVISHVAGQQALRVASRRHEEVMKICERRKSR